jgi:hypothetical protein
MLGDDVTEFGIGPVDSLAETIASGEIELDLAETHDTDKLQELAESGELGEIDAELEAQIEVIRSILGERSN